MKNLTIILMLCIGFISCDTKEYNLSLEQSLKDKGYKNFLTYQDNLIAYDTITINQHLYIIGRDFGPHNGGYFLTHAGECTNPIHFR